MNFEILPTEYFNHGYNNTMNNERCIEIPLSVRYLQEVEIKNTIEVGAVMPYYFKDIPYPIIDIADERATQKTDACNIDYKNKNVLSISTLEHIDEVPESKCTSIELLNKILEESNSCFITIPMGYNKPLDQYILNNCKYYAYKKISQYLWDRKDTIDLCEYGTPFMFANGLLIIHKG